MGRILALLIAVSIATVAIIAQYVPTANCTYEVYKVTTTTCQYITTTQIQTITETFVINSTATTTTVYTTTNLQTNTVCNSGPAGAIANMTCLWITPVPPTPPPPGGGLNVPNPSTPFEYSIAALALGLLFAAFAAKTSEMSMNYIAAAIAMLIVSAAASAISPLSTLIGTLATILFLTAALVFLRRK
ncbi:MAG: hypothetical protein QXT27_02775 [Pyrobaculum sp.]